MRFRGPALLLLFLLLLSLTGAQAGLLNTAPVFSDIQPETAETQALVPEATTASSSATVIETTAAEAVVETPKLRFMAVGDIMPGRRVGKKLEAGGGYASAFSGVEPILKQGDVVFANLEAPLTASGHGLSKEKKIVLKGSPGAIEAIKAGGFNLISLSNNHIMDYYDVGLFDTISLLDENGIAHAGAGKNLEEAGRPAIIEKNGYKIGLLCYTDMAKLIYAGKPNLSFEAGPEKAGVVPRDYEVIKQAIADLRDKVDLLAVSLHWGVEESFTVTPEQVDFARKLLDDGADMILGHHPHQFQGMEIYKGKPIIYSMGNFLFDQNDPENMESFIVEMQYEGTALKSLTAIPVSIVDKSRVELQTGEAAANLLKREGDLCGRLGTAADIAGDTLVLNKGE